MSSRARSVDLNGRWSLWYGDQAPGAPERPGELRQSGWPRIDAQVPGNVEIDLMEAGVLPRALHHGDAIYQLRALEKYRWWYGRRFASPELAEGERAILLFGGIDCIAEVFINGASAGRCRNMLVEQPFDVTDLLRAGENELHVRIDSAVLEGRRHKPEPIEHAGSVNWESLAVRKAPHMYGWDILPRLVSAGLWRGVALNVQPATRLEDVYFATLRVDAPTRQAEVQVSWHIATHVNDIDAWQVEVTLWRGERLVHTQVHAVVGTAGRVQTRLREVEPWWPRGSGGQALYGATVRLVGEQGEVLAEHVERIGIRTVELRRTDVTDDAGSGEFVFVVNGRRIYCRGTNHVPLDALHSRDERHFEGVLEMLVELNCNMVRCWGGNVYEDAAFFAGCDERGILVWQDFAMACAIYPQTQAFSEEIRHEAEAVVRKLRNHPSLALWAGNNEIDQAYGWSGLGRDPNGDIHSRGTLPEVCRRLDPHRAYLPSSPYIAPELFGKGDLHRHSPEDHLWGPRDDFKGQYYTTSNAHFVSEIGYHGCPSRETLEAMIERDALWPWQKQDAWLTHAVRPHPLVTSYNHRIELMAKQIRVLFDRDPETLDDFIFASQVSQAEAKKFFIERWRIGKWRRTGMLWWNLRDGWPVISDAVVDYFGRRKLAYAFIQRVQADVCVSVGEADTGRHGIYVLNDTQEAVELDVEIRDVESGRALWCERVKAAADAATRVGEIAKATQPGMWQVCFDGGSNHYLAGPRPYALQQYRRWLEQLRLAR